jgi:hypothetical protein
MTDTYLDVETKTSKGAGEHVGHVLRTIAETLDDAPENRRYDLELKIEEHCVDTETDRDGGGRR